MMTVNTTSNTTSESASQTSSGFPIYTYYPYKPTWPAAAAYTVYFTFFLGLYLWRRDQEPIKSRGWAMAVCSAVAAYVYMVFDTIDFDLGVFGFGNVYYSCYPEAFTSALFLPMWFFPYFYRSYILYIRFRLNDDGLNSQMDKDKLNNWVFRYKWTLSFKSFAICYTVVFIFVMIVSIAVIWGYGVNAGRYFMGFEDCFGHLRDFIAFLGATSIVIIIIAVVVLWRVRDAYAFKIELAVVLIFGFPIFIVWIVANLAESLPPEIPTLVWELLMVFVSFTVSIVLPFVLSFFPKYNSLVLHSSHNSSDLTSDIDRQSITVIEFHEPGTVKFFVDLLEDPVLSEEFKQFCVELWCVENCIFYYAATIFAENPPRDQMRRLEEAQSIYDRFIRPGAPQEINIEASVRERIFEILSQESGEIPATTFSEAVKKVFAIMRSDTYKKFLQSSRFYGSYLSSPVGLAGGDQAETWLHAHRSENAAFRPNATIHKKKPRRKPTTKRTVPQQVTEDVMLANLPSDSVTSNGTKTSLDTNLANEHRPSNSSDANMPLTRKSTELSAS